VEHIRGHLWTQIFHSSQLSHGGDIKVVLPKANIGSRTAAQKS
jgi:hypothetical protein